jgi:hypothetical protein
MNYNQNWNNPQQQYHQQSPRAPQPPRNNTKLVILICGLALLLFGGLFYFVAFVGKTMGSVVGTTSKKVKGLDSVFGEILNAPFDPTNSFYYSAVINSINADSVMADDEKTKLLNNINTMRKNADKTRQLLKLYEDGFSDTLPDKRKYSSFDKKWANEYFITSGRSASLKESLTVFRDQALNNLPGKTQQGRFETIMDELSADWDNDHFNRSSDIVKVNLNTIRTQLSTFEQSILNHYTDYLDEQSQ